MDRQEKVSQENLEEKFLADILSVLNSAIIRTLQNLPKDVSAIVAGGKAINAMLKLPNRVVTVDWDLHPFNPKYVEDLNSPAHDEARDTLGRLLVENLTELFELQLYRLRPILDHYQTTVTEIVYRVNPLPGTEYALGRVSFITSRFKRVPAIDLLHLPKPEHYITFNRVNFATLPTLIETLEYLVNLPGHKKREKNIGRLESIKYAIENDGLSCNYYRMKYLARVTGQPDPDYAKITGPEQVEPVPPPQLVRNVRMIERRQGKEEAEEQSEAVEDAEVAEFPPHLTPDILESEIKRINYRGELDLCGNSTMMGPIDPLLPEEVRPVPRYLIA